MRLHGCLPAVATPRRHWEDDRGLHRKGHPGQRGGLPLGGVCVCLHMATLDPFGPVNPIKSPLRTPTVLREKVLACHLAGPPPQVGGWMGWSQSEYAPERLKVYIGYIL